MIGIPEYGFKCPKCGVVSGEIVMAKTERHDIMLNWSPAERAWVSTKKSKPAVCYRADLRCPSCEEVIEHPNEGLVKLTTGAESVGDQP